MAGRKSKYFTNVEPHLDKIREWCVAGMLEEEICRRLHVSVSAFAEYKNLFPALVKTLKEGKEPADDAVEAALFKAATGYRYEEVKTEGFVDADDRVKKQKTVTTKEVPPNVTAAIFWLKNRRPKKWRDRHELGVEGEVATKLIAEEKNL